MKNSFRTLTLAGVKHSGKSTLGRSLAQRCGVKFYDADDVLAAEQSMSIRELFRAVGQEKFRELEAQTVGQLAELDEDKVISLGGGAVTNAFISEDTWRTLGVKIMIDISDETAQARVFANGVPAYLEKYSDPAAALKEINAVRRQEMKKRCDVIYVADAALSAGEQSERFCAFLKERSIL